MKNMKFPIITISWTTMIFQPMFAVMASTYLEVNDVNFFIPNAVILIARWCNGRTSVQLHAVVSSFKPALET